MADFKSETSGVLGNCNEHSSSSRNVIRKSHNFSKSAKCKHNFREHIEERSGEKSQIYYRIIGI